MQRKWYRGVSNNDPDGVEERAELVKSARPTLELLKTIMEDRRKELRQQMQDKQHYELASWPYMQADTLGAIRELDSIIELLTLEKIT